MNVSQQLIGNAVVPTDSQRKVVLSESVRKHTIHIRPFGETFCLFICYDLIFLTPGKKNTYPCTEIPETRLMLGMEACYENRTIVLMHHDYPDDDSDAVVKFDFYSIDADFKARLVRTVSTFAECRANGMSEHFTSPRHGEYTALFADFFNHDFFKTLEMSIKSTTEIKVESC